ncbi:MAG TPA: amidohydrolase family protein [Puia sp.]|jgi:L-fuconolactonase|nr:amidohydrolase family protein [Puia sp.]
MEASNPVKASPVRIDAHQHFWKYDPVKHGWIHDAMWVIRRDYSPADLLPLLQAAGMDGCVAVQVNQTEDENKELLALAAEYDFIRGVVGWIDLQHPEVEFRLEWYKEAYPKMKGFRHILQGERDRALMLKPAFKRGIGLLKKFGYTYDILIFPDQLGYTQEFVSAFPDQPFIIDHIAKPHIKDRYITEEWKDAIRAVAVYPNVWCKISGMVTEADWRHWKPEHFKPYLDTVVEAFGSKRIVFGSDWPVCLVAAGYEQVVQIVDDYFAAFTADERAALFGGNAVGFYNL